MTSPEELRALAARVKENRASHNELAAALFSAAEQLELTEQARDLWQRQYEEASEREMMKAQQCTAERLRANAAEARVAELEKQLDILELRWAEWTGGHIGVLDVAEAVGEIMVQRFSDSAEKSPSR